MKSNMDSSEDFELCDVCDQPAYDVCEGCVLAVYCSQECQAVEWPEHKDICYIDHSDQINIESEIEHIEFKGMNRRNRARRKAKRRVRRVKRKGRRRVRKEKRKEKVKKFKDKAKDKLKGAKDKLGEAKEKAKEGASKITKRKPKSNSKGKLKAGAAGAAGGALAVAGLK